MTYEALKSQIQAALDADDMGAIKRLFVPATGGVQTQDSGPHGGPPPPPDPLV